MYMRIRSKGRNFRGNPPEKPSKYLISAKKTIFMQYPVTAGLILRREIRSANHRLRSVR